MRPRVLDETDGDALMFLPGSSEIHRLRAQVESRRIAGLNVQHYLGNNGLGGATGPPTLAILPG